MNLKSFTNNVSKYVTQIISFKNGEKKTIKNIITSEISQSEFTKLPVKDGRIFAINTKEVNWFETIKE